MERPFALHACSPSNQPPPNDLPALIPGPSQPKTRNKLSMEGMVLLEGYWSKNPSLLQPPPLSDRKLLTRAIKELPGCGFWGDVHTNDWFKRRRKKFQRDHVSSSKLVAPSNDAIQHLGVLLKGQPNPSPDVIATWATLLARDGGSVEVKIWTGYITQVVQASCRSSDCALLPTPAGTVTPEPLMPQPSGPNNQSLPLKMKRDPVDSPNLASLSIQTQSTTTSPVESPVSPFHTAGQTLPPVTSLHAIIGDAMQAIQHPTDRIRPLPNDADEFLAMFAPYEAKLIKLLNILESEH